MVAFRPEIVRAYVATAAVIAGLLVVRSHHDLSWSADVVLMAGFGDLLVVGMLALLYRLVDRFVRQDSLANRVNRMVHWVAILAIILWAGLAQALFLKTGEVLSADMLVFFVRRSGELAQVATGAMDVEMAMVLLLCAGMLLLACFRFRRRLLTGLQYATFAFPIGLISAGPLVFPDIGSGPEIELPSHLKAGVLYQGSYRNFAERQFQWNTSGVADWQKGILTGMSVGAALGVLQYRAIAEAEVAERIYVAPTVAKASASPPNILFLLLESVRHNALGVYASGSSATQSDTPFLDQVAREGWRVEHAYTTVPHTSKALVGIYCGTFPRFETEIIEAQPGGLALTCLPHLLGAAGYRSGHFQTAPGSFEDRLQFLDNVGFDDHFTQESITGSDWSKLGYLGVDDRAMVAPAIEWMRSQTAGGVPFFASLLTIASHHPYVSPGNIGAVESPAQANAAYVKAIRYTDRLVAELFAEMRKHGLLDNTLVVITGDHGEAFSEHGQIGHNGVGYEEGIRVPLILHGPMLGAPRVIPGLRQHIDIMPTVLEAAGIGFAGMLPGKSLSDNAQGHSELITSCFYSDYCLSHQAADGRKILFFHGKRTAEMYDLQADPAERRNLFARSTQDDAMQRLHRAVRMKKSFEAVHRVGSNENDGR